MNNMKDKNVAILGFGLEGKDLANYLLSHGAKITIIDQKKEEELDFNGVDKEKFNFLLGDNYSLDTLDSFDIIFRSPGVYRYLPEIVMAEKKGVEISSAIKLFFDECPAKIVGITGTKGKGTTSTLIYEIFKEDGKSVFLAGNIGTPYLSLLKTLTVKDIVVLEISSFQLIDMNKSPHVAVVLNITQDHLDWHKSLKEYVDAKKNIVVHQKKTDFSVINADYETPKSFAELTIAQKYFFSTKEKVKGSYVEKDTIYLSVNKKEIIGGTNYLILRGNHNLENVTAAICASSLLGANVDSIKKAAFSFKGLEHRLEFVAKVGGRSFYNDSFATGPQPTIAAINSFSEPTTVILGGSEKGLTYDELGKVLSTRENIMNAILIGQVADKIKISLKKAGFKKNIVELGKSDIEGIVKKAYEITPKGGVILLSPAAASFDMFENYKDRGKKFKKSVHKLSSNE